MDSLGSNIDTIVIQFVVLLFSLSIHEASHAWTADRLGDPTAWRLGRVSLNPMVHVDLVGTLLFPLLQIVTNLPLIGWAKPVPVDPARLRRPGRDQILVSLAGPAANLLAAGAAFALLFGLKLASLPAGAVLDSLIRTHAIPHTGAWITPVVALLYFALVVNLALALFNVIPIPPLDGHWLLYAVLPMRAAALVARGGMFGFAVLYVLMFTGVFSLLFVPIRAVLDVLGGV